MNEGPDPRGGRRGSHRILLADPDSRVLAQLGNAVTSAGYSVGTVATAAALLDAVRRVPTHLLVLAPELPDMAAVDIIERIHTVCVAPPIVLLARHGTDPRHGPLRERVAACLFKPVDTARLVGICERLLRLADQRLHEGDWRIEPRRSISLEVVVETHPGLPTLTATLVDLSARGFRIELPEAVGVGRRVRVGVRIPESSKVLNFEGRVVWEKPLSRGTLAGGDLTSVGTEDARILAALL